MAENEYPYGQEPGIEWDGLKRIVRASYERPSTRFDARAVILTGGAERFAATGGEGTR